MRFFLPAVFAAALVFTLVMAWLPHPPPVPFHEDDKFWHVVAFVTLAALAGLAFPAAPLTRIGERLSFLGALIEVVQSIPSLHRDCDIRDWIADTIAIIVTLAVIAWIRRLGRRRAAEAPAREP
jgi:hypothetical protein